MTHEVEPLYDPVAPNRVPYVRPYIVKVDGKILMTLRGNPRRFKNSMQAAVAGAHAAKGPKPRRAAWRHAS